MPLYEYRCGDCGHELEVLQKISDPAPVECPSCHHASLQKKVTAAGFQLKGTGWYVTDFRGGQGSAAPAKAADAPAAKAADAPAAAGSSEGSAPAAAPAPAAAAPSASGSGPGAG